MLSIFNSNKIEKKKINIVCAKSLFLAEMLKSKSPSNPKKKNNRKKNR